MALTIPNVFVPNTVIKSTEVNANFTAVANYLNGTATIARSAIEVGTANHVVINSGTGALSSEATLALSRGGTGAGTKAAAFDALSPMTTSGDLIYGGASGTGTRLAKGSDGQFLKLVSGLPAWANNSVTATPPTVQRFTSGSGTYTLPANVLYILVEMVGGGGGGGGSGTTATTAGNGGDTTFGSSLLSAGGGVGGNTNGDGGTGGVASLGTGPIGIARSGNGAMGSLQTLASQSMSGAAGAPSALGGGGRGRFNAAGTAAETNSGGGGAGGGVDGSKFTGAGGGSGGYVKAIITSPSSSYSYAVGVSGTAGSAGTNGAAGGAGGSGLICVWEYYQ